jgi:hypothetical protein
VKCFFAGRRGWGPCDGALIRAHLVPKRMMKRELWAALNRTLAPEPARDRLRDLMWDPRAWVPCCGGPTGIGGHHAVLDTPGLSLAPRLRRNELPEGLEAFVSELDGMLDGREPFAVWVDKTYGPKGMAT